MHVLSSARKDAEGSEQDVSGLETNVVNCISPSVRVQDSFEYWICFKHESFLFYSIPFLFMSDASVIYNQQQVYGHVFIFIDSRKLVLRVFFEVLNISFKLLGVKL